MTMVEWCVVGAGIVALLVWLRGCRRGATGDCALALALAVAAAAGYFFAFSLTRTPYVAAAVLAPFALGLLLFRSFVAKPAGKVMLAAAILLTVVAAGVEYKLVSMGNALLVIEPYRADKTSWKFDEPRLRLQAEPFVQGIPEMIDKMVEGIPGSDKKVRLIFSQRPFPGWTFQLDHRREQDGGNWYYNEKYQMEGWLCPALFKFFPRAPRHIYVKAEPVVS